MIYLYYSNKTNKINVSKTLIDGEKIISDVKLENGTLYFSNIVHLTKILMVTEFDINNLKSFF